MVCKKQTTLHLVVSDEQFIRVVELRSTLGCPLPFFVVTNES
jgi:hypothetical protein